MATFQQQISASLDDTHASSDVNFPTLSYARFGVVPFAKAPMVVDAFFRFLLNIPKGSIINSAFLTFVAYSSRTNDFTAQINFTNEDDAANFSTNPYSRADGGTDVPWAVPDFVAGQSVQTPNIASLIQAFINRAGYNANNYIAIRIKHGDAAVDEYMEVYQWDYGDHTYAAILTVDYTPPVVAKHIMGDGLVWIRR